MKRFNFYTLPMSSDVLRFITDYLNKNYKFTNMEKICIIFGGKRPALILKKYLSEAINSPFIPPKIFSTDEFINYVLSKKYNLKYITELDLVYLIYTLTKENPVFKKKFRSFLSFIPWGYEISNFIDELWLEDITPDKLKSVQLQAEIGFNIPGHVNELLKVLSYLTETLQQKLMAEGLTTRGFSYNLVSKLAQELKLTEFNEIMFVTPFYLHTTEYKVISGLMENNEVTLIFQGSRKNFKQLELLSKKFNIDISAEDQEINENKKIYFYAAFDRISEMNFVHRILNELPPNQINDTLVVLPNDNLATLLPNFLPQKIKEFNLVCGYPFKHSLVYSFFYSIFVAQINKKNKGYHTKDYIKVIKNPLTIKIISAKYQNVELISCVVNTIEAVLLGEITIENLSRSIFVNIKHIQDCDVLYHHIQKNFTQQVPVKTLKEILIDLHQFLFFQWEKITNISQLCTVIKNVLDHILKSLNDTKDLGLTNEILNRLYTYNDSLLNVSFSKQKFKSVDIYKFILDEFDKLTIPLHGSPLRGLQILGFYETRNLNFKNVIILNANEGIIPFIASKTSFIPRQVLINLGIDRMEIEEEIQRYHFSRLIAQAETVHLIYTESDEKEKSRFVEQLIWQQQLEYNKFKIDNMFYGYQKVSLIPRKIEVKKTDSVIYHLINTEYSPTMLDTYLECPLKFYYSYVLSLQEPETIEEPEGKDIGKFVHELLEITFKEFLGKKPVIDEKFKNSFFSTFELKFKSELEKRFVSESFLLKRVMEHFFQIFLNHEQKRVVNDKVECIFKLEAWLYDTIDLNGKKLKFKYKIDRIDKLEDGTLLVIDYKTGTIEAPVKNLELTELNRDIIKRKIKSFQLPLYVLVVDKSFRPPNTNAMFYNVKDPKESELLFVKNTYTTIREEFKNKILSALKHIILDEILNPEVPFYADDTNSRICNQCSFQYLCR